jgi:site-specific recombinase XerD
LFSDKSFKRLIHGVQRRARLSVTGESHIFRHTYCSHVAMSGVPAKAIQELAGRVELSTTMKYLHLAPGETRRAVDLLENRAGHLTSRGDRRARANGGLTKLADSATQHHNS